MSSPEFVALADVLRGAASAPHLAATPCEDGGAEGAQLERRSPEAHAAPPHADADDDRSAYGDVVAAVREARLFRARLADAFDDAVARLVRELACDVLARELRLAPCDLHALARSVAESAPVVRLRVAPEDADAPSPLPLVADPLLQRGDAIVELAGGSIDARLGVRLAAVLERVA